MTSEERQLIDVRNEIVSALEACENVLNEDSLTAYMEAVIELSECDGTLDEKMALAHRVERAQAEVLNRWERMHKELDRKRELESDLLEINKRLAMLEQLRRLKGWNEQCR